jgi:peptide/nickel transport system ATP-binding protein
MANNEILKINNLVTSFRIKQDFYAAVDDVSLSVRENEIIAIVGESGCGKSALALSVTSLHNKNYTKIEGEILFKGQDLLKLAPGELNKIRGKDIGMIFQDPLTALNPLMTVGAQIAETLGIHENMSKGRQKEFAIDLLNQVGITDPALTYGQYPHELSGGMRQRAMIAIAVSCNPSLIIADEPTTALDVTIQAQILDLIKKLQREHRTATMLITHDLGVVAEMADRIAVMYAGQIVEMSPAREFFKNPKHPYTRSLLSAIPTLTTETDKLYAIEGSVPTLVNLPREGCRFSPRTPWVPHEYHEEVPEYHEVGPEHFVLCTCYEKFTLDNNI